MPGGKEVPGQLLLLDEHNTPVTAPEACVFDWFTGLGRAEFRFRSRHDIPIPKGTTPRTIAIANDAGRILWAHPIIGVARLSVKVIPDPDQLEVNPGEELPKPM